MKSRVESTQQCCQSVALHCSRMGAHELWMTGAGTGKHSLAARPPTTRRDDDDYTKTRLTWKVENNCTSSFGTDDDDESSRDDVAMDECGWVGEGWDESRLCNWLAATADEDHDIWRTSTVAKEARLIETVDDEKAPDNKT